MFPDFGYIRSVLHAERQKAVYDVVLSCMDLQSHEAHMRACVVIGVILFILSLIHMLCCCFCYCCYCCFSNIFIPCPQSYILAGKWQCSGSVSTTIMFRQIIMSCCKIRHIVLAIFGLQWQCPPQHLTYNNKII